MLMTEAGGSLVVMRRIAALCAFLMPMAMVCIGGAPASAGVRLEPSAADGAAEASLAGMQAEDWRQQHRLLIGRQARLEQDLARNERSLRRNEAQLRRLAAAIAVADDADARMLRLQGEQQAKMVQRRQRLELLLAEIVQLSRREAANPRRLGQLRAVAGSLSAPYMEAEAALARMIEARAAIAARQDELHASALEARMVRADLLARRQRLTTAVMNNRGLTTAAAARVHSASGVAALLEQRVALARAADELPAMRMPIEPAGLALRHSTGSSISRVGRSALSARAVADGRPIRVAAHLDVQGTLPLAVGAVDGERVPVMGAVISRFGEGRKPPFDRGVTIEVDDRRLVRAPRSGRVVFARAYEGFGLLLIIDHGNEYHTLLSGLSRFVVHEGWVVRAGQMIGTIEPGTKSVGQLYVELRRRGVPVDPLDWFAAGQDKVRS
jgi:septal ring factor EnvC (AmiA/AmiB activator)